MDKKTLSLFETRLLDLQVEVMGIADLVDRSSQTVELDQNRQGRLSRMDAIQGQAIAQAGAQRQAEHLTLIAEALVRIDASDFGLCLQCDEEIAAARLIIDPTVRHCIGCAELLEQS